MFLSFPAENSLSYASESARQVTFSLWPEEKIG